MIFVKFSVLFIDVFVTFVTFSSMLESSETKPLEMNRKPQTTAAKAIKISKITIILFPVSIKLLLNFLKILSMIKSFKINIIYIFFFNRYKYYPII